MSLKGPALHLTFCYIYIPNSFFYVSTFINKLIKKTSFHFSQIINDNVPHFIKLSKYFKLIMDHVL